MPQVFNRGANGLARMSLVILGLVVTSLALTLNELQRSPYLTSRVSGWSSRFRSAISTTLQVSDSIAGTVTRRWKIRALLEFRLPKPV